MLACHVSLLYTISSFYNDLHSECLVITLWQHLCTLSWSALIDVHVTVPDVSALLTNAIPAGSGLVHYYINWRNCYLTSRVNTLGWSDNCNWNAQRNRLTDYIMNWTTSSVRWRFCKCWQLLWHIIKPSQFYWTRYLLKCSYPIVEPYPDSLILNSHFQEVIFIYLLFINFPPI
jgi:hypothetical protein